DRGASQRAGRRPGVSTRDVEEGEGPRRLVAEEAVENAVHLTMVQIVFHDHLVVNLPLELKDRLLGGGGDGAGAFLVDRDHAFPRGRRPVLEPGMRMPVRGQTSTTEGRKVTGRGGALLAVAALGLWLSGCAGLTTDPTAESRFSMAQD